MGVHPGLPWYTLGGISEGELPTVGAPLSPIRLSLLDTGCSFYEVPSTHPPVPWLATIRNPRDFNLLAMVYPVARCLEIARTDDSRRVV